MKIFLLILLSLLLPIFPAIASFNCKANESFQHFISLPKDYALPNGPQFDLYFETNEKFDPTLPTILALSDGQQPEDIRGRAEKVFLSLNDKFNVALIQHRGLFCSRFEGGDPFKVFLSNQVLQDIESVRKKLLGNRKWILTGESGAGLLSLQYLAAFPDSVARVAAITPSLPGTKGSLYEREFIEQVLHSWGLDPDFLNNLPTGINPNQFAFLLNRIGYTQPLRSKDTFDLIKPVLEGNHEKYNELNSKYGLISEFKAIAKHFPTAPVRLAEVMDPTRISQVLRLTIEPLIPNWEFYGKKILLDSSLLLEKLRNVNVPVLLVGGVDDHVVPPAMLQEWRAYLPFSTIVLLKTTHAFIDQEKCLQDGRRKFLFYGSIDGFNRPECQVALSQ